MRMLLSLLSLCALLVGQTPFTPCPAAVTADERAARTPRATGEAAHHHHVATEPDRHAGADVRLPAPHRDGGTCTMLTRCDWVAVATEPVACEPVRDFAFATVVAVPPAPATAELFAPTPPPRAVS